MELESHRIEGVGLKIGLSMLPQNFDSIGFLLLSSPSLSVAVDSLINYSPIIGEGGVFAKFGCIALRICHAEIGQRHGSFSKLKACVFAIMSLEPQHIKDNGNPYRGKVHRCAFLSFASTPNTEI